MASVPVPPSWNVEYVLAETLFAQLLRLPSSGERPLLYGIVLADLCRLRATTGALILPKMAPALAATVGQLFRRVPTMDIECRCDTPARFGGVGPCGGQGSLESRID